jgi:hypothetical protein
MCCRRQSVFFGAVVSATVLMGIATAYGQTTGAVPNPILEIANIPELPSTSFYYGARFNPSSGLLYLWDGTNVYRQNGVNVDGFTKIGEVSNNMSDAGPIQFSSDGTQILLGNGAGGWGPYVGHPEYAGEIFTMSIAGGTVTQPISTIQYHYDITTLPKQSTIVGTSQKYFVDFGWQYYQSDPKSWVSVFDASTGVNTVVLANIPGASGAITTDSSGNLYACVGYGEERGLIKKFSLAAIDAAFNSGTPLSWSDGVALNANNYNNQSAAGMFFDSRGYLFAGGNEGLTVFRPDGVSETYDVGAGVYSSITYDPVNDELLVMTNDRFGNPVFDVYLASDFTVVPEPSTLVLLAALGITVAAYGYRRRFSFRTKQ